MVNIDIFTRRIARAIDFPEMYIQLIAKSILEADLTKSDNKLEQFVKWQLKETGIGKRWNYILDQRRSEYLAKKIMNLLPEENPVILDILSGTGTVAEALRDLGCTVIETDRLSHYPKLSGSKKVLDLEEDWGQVSKISADVVLVLTSLHHESNLNQFIGKLATLKTKRFIIIENLRTEETEYDLHSRMDWFFNRCLNSFGAECPGWYWSREQWEILLGSLGNVQWKYTMDDVPGIPFTYDLFDIKR